MIGQLMNDLNNHYSIYTLPISVLLLSKADKFVIKSDDEDLFYIGYINRTDNNMIIISVHKSVDGKTKDMLVDNITLTYDGDKLITREHISIEQLPDENDEHPKNVYATTYTYNNNIIRSSVSTLNEWHKQTTLYKVKNALLQEWTETDWFFVDKYKIEGNELRIVHCNANTKAETINCIFVFDGNRITKHINAIVDTEYIYAYVDNKLDSITWDEECESNTKVQFFYNDVNYK